MAQPLHFHTGLQLSLLQMHPAQSSSTPIDSAPRPPLPTALTGQDPYLQQPCFPPDQESCQVACYGTDKTSTRPRLGCSAPSQLCLKWNGGFNSCYQSLCSLLLHFVPTRPRSPTETFPCGRRNVMQRKPVPPGVSSNQIYLCKETDVIKCCRWSQRYGPFQV